MAAATHGDQLVLGQVEVGDVAAAGQVQCADGEVARATGGPDLRLDSAVALDTAGRAGGRVAQIEPVPGQSKREVALVAARPCPTVPSVIRVTGARWAIEGWLQPAKNESI